MVALGWLCAALLLAPQAAWPGRDDGQRALQARQGGRVLPLELLIQQVAAVIPGRLLEAELEEDEGQLAYELRWQLVDGRRLELELDASDGRWLKLKGPRLETVFRGAAAGPAAKGPADPGAPPR